MFHFVYFNAFLTTGGGEFCCVFSIGRVVQGKIVHFVNKCQILHIPSDDFIIMSIGPEGPKIKFYQITSVLISFESI